MNGRTLALASILALSNLPGWAQVSLRVAVPGLRVRVGPPAARLEARPLAPSPSHHWIPGYWAWRGGTHVWVGGQWLLPPRAGLVWTPARWDRAGRRWVYYEGYWEDSAPAAPTSVYDPPAPGPEEVEVAPPPPIAELRPAIPFAGAIWIGGDWHWDGHRHVWIAGRWSAARPGQDWAPGHWAKGPRGHWHHVPGHWRH